MSQVSTLPLPAKRSKSFKDETEKKRGKWTVLGYAGKNKHGKVVWLCSCECGAEHVVTGRDLRSGHSTQCAHCAVIESQKKASAAAVASGAVARNLKNGTVVAAASGAPARNFKIASIACTTHGLSGHPQYSRWRGMNNRCYNPNNRKYDYYGARGIQVCPEWRRTNPEGCKNFVEWFEANKPTTNEKLDLHRTDNDGDYSSENIDILTETEHKEAHRLERS